MSRACNYTYYFLLIGFARLYRFLFVVAHLRENNMQKTRYSLTEGKLEYTNARFASTDLYPMALLCFLSKVLEIVLRDQIYRYTENLLQR